VWSLRSGGGGAEETVKVTGSLSSNHGEIALQWAVEGAGIVLRSQWDAQPYLHSGELVQYCPSTRKAPTSGQSTPAPRRLAKVRVCVNSWNSNWHRRTGRILVRPPLRLVTQVVCRMRFKTPVSAVNNFGVRKYFGQFGIQQHQIRTTPLFRVVFSAYALSKFLADTQAGLHRQFYPCS
jgi:hypothetical protein